MPVKQFSDIKVLYRLLVYYTQAAYTLITGNNPPPFDPNKPAKLWQDVNLVYCKQLGTSDIYTYTTIAYSRVKDARSNINTPLLTEDGKPFLTTEYITRDQAQSVNIPPEGNLGDNVYFYQPPPCRALTDLEELDYGGLPEIVRIKNKDFVGTPGQVGDLATVLESLSVISRDLQKICSVLGIPK